MRLSGLVSCLSMLVESTGPLRRKGFSGGKRQLDRKKKGFLILFGIEERREGFSRGCLPGRWLENREDQSVFEKGEVVIFRERGREGDCIINSPRNSHKFSSKWAATFHHTGEHTRCQSTKERSMLLVYRGRNRLPRSQKSMHNTQGTFL